MFNFRRIRLVKVKKNSYPPPINGLNSITAVLLQVWFWHWITGEIRYAIKQRNRIDITEAQIWLVTGVICCYRSTVGHPTKKKQCSYVKLGFDAVFSRNFWVNIFKTLIVSICHLDYLWRVFFYHLSLLVEFKESGKIWMMRSCVSKLNEDSHRKAVTWVILSDPFSLVALFRVVFTSLLCLFSKLLHTIYFPHKQCVTWKSNSVEILWTGWFVLLFNGISTF